MATGTTGSAFPASKPLQEDIVAAVLEAVPRQVDMLVRLSAAMAHVTGWPAPALRQSY